MDYRGGQVGVYSPAEPAANREGDLMNSKGLFAYDRRTDLDFSLTVRTDDDLGSGFVARDYNDAARFDSATTTEKERPKRSG